MMRSWRTFTSLSLAGLAAVLLVGVLGFTPSAEATRCSAGRVLIFPDGETDCIPGGGTCYVCYDDIWVR